MFAKKKKKKDYSPNKYAQNPLFNHRKRKSKHKTRKRAYVFSAGISIIILIIGFVVWFTLFSNYFIIKNLDTAISGNINSEEIKQKFWQQTSEKRLLFLQSNFFVFNANQLEKKLHLDYNLESIKVVKHWPDKIQIEAVQKKYSLVWTEADRYYYLDDFGNIILETGQNDPELKKFALIQNLGDLRAKNQSVEIDQAQIKFILALFAELPVFNKLFQYDKFILDSNPHTVKLATKQGPVLMFNADDDLNNQITKLETVLKEKIKKNFKQKKYIDLRYGDMVYIQ
jgi:cell division septal protein FtsQ